MDALTWDALERACNEVVRVALSRGCSATEVRQMMAYSWKAVLEEQAKWGAEEFTRERA